MNGADFRRDGVKLIEQVLSPRQCARAASEVRTSGAGTRCLLAQAWCATLAETVRAHATLASMLAPDMVAVQCTYFEKSAQRNWLVPMHQDLSIPVAARVEAAALSGWSIKESIQFVRAPDELLAQLVAVRIHLDPCGAEDGPLRVVPGSHAFGVLTDDAAGALRAERGERVCVAAAGSALVLRPLLLHASSKGRGTGARRVLHFLFGPPELPFGLRWHTAR